MAYTPFILLSLKRNRSDIVENTHEALNKMIILRSKLAKLSKKISQSIHLSSRSLSPLFPKHAYPTDRNKGGNDKAALKHLPGILINHTHHQSHITVNSEDLTAKEFADIAGITILPEIEREFSREEHDNDDTLSIQSSVDSSPLKRPQIWDSDFWSRPERNDDSVTLNDPSNLHLADNNKNSVVIIKRGRFEIQLEGVFIV